MSQTRSRESSRAMESSSSSRRPPLAYSNARDASAVRSAICRVALRCDGDGGGERIKETEVEQAGKEEGKMRR